MKRLKKWTYLFLFLGTGVIYLSCVDHWQVYAESLAQVKNWYHDLEVEEKLLAYAGNVQSTGQPSFMDDGQYVSAPGSTSYTGDKESIGNKESLGKRVKDRMSGEFGGEEPSNNGDDNETVEPDGEGGVGDEPEVTEPVYMSVEDDYFADAVFIGDSRTLGMFEYGGIEEISTFYASRGLTIYKMFEAELAEVSGSKKKISVEEALQQNTFSKIYLMLGINEMGGRIESFIERYRETIERLKELQPDAIIYIQAIIKVTAERSAKGDYITNEGIEERNNAIAEMADNERVFYLDVNPYVCDETGGMVSSYTFDGVHLKAQYIEIWKDFLKEHAICLDE